MFMRSSSSSLLRPLSHSSSLLRPFSPSSSPLSFSSLSSSSSRPSSLPLFPFFSINPSRSRFYSDLPPKPSDQPTSGKPKHRMNGEIKAPEVLLISETGEKLGIQSIAVALEAARAKKMDLIEVSMTHDPEKGKDFPVCRITPLPARPPPATSSSSASSQKGGKGGAGIPQTAQTKPPKEVMVRQEIAAHDLQVKVGKINDFLSKGLSVKITVLPKPKRITEPKQQEAFFSSIMAGLQAPYSVSSPPKAMGRSLVAILAAKKAP